MENSTTSRALKALRQRSGMSVQEVADALGRPKSTYASYEDKFKKDYLPPELVLKLADVWSRKGIERREILALGGMDAPRAPVPSEPDMPKEVNTATWPRDVPVRGIASCGDDGLFEFNNGDVIDYVKRPPRLSNIKGSYALYVVGESMSPWREPGEPVYVHPGLPVSINDYVVVQLKPRHDGDPPSAYIKRLVKRTHKEIRLLQFNPHKEISIKPGDVLSIQRVLGWSELMLV